jgi:hypothetical protein
VGFGEVPTLQYLHSFWLLDGDLHDDASLACKNYGKCGKTMKGEQSSNFVEN